MSAAVRVAAGRQAWAAALLALGGIALAAPWSHWLTTLVLAVAAVLPMLALRQVLRLGVSRPVATVVLTLLLVLAAYLLGASAGSGLVSTVTDAVPRLLTEPQPLAGRPDLLVAPVLLAGLTGLLTGLRLDSPTRIAPVAGGLALYVAGLLLTTGQADPHGVLAALLLGTAVAGWILLDGDEQDTRHRLGRAGPLVVVGAGFLAASGLVPAAHPFEPRDLVEPPVVTVQLSSPLPRLGAWAANPDVELMRVTGDPVPLRLAVLDEYDGTQWLAATRYAPLGTESDATLPQGSRRSRVSVKVTLGELGGNWLPTPGAPSAVSDPETLVDPATGTLYSPGVAAGLTYDVDALVDDPLPEDLLGATVPSRGPVSRYLEQPELPFDLATYSNLITDRASTPYARALAIESAVRRGRRLSSQSISGSAHWRLQSFLLGDRGEPGARIGTSEQFATAFAVLARNSGLPTRVVVGFRPGTETPDGTRVVRGSDALAWPEVYFADLGWVPFSPTPNDDTFAADRPQPGQAPRGTEVAVPPPTPTPEPNGRSDGADGPTTAQTVGLVAALAGGVLGGPLLVLWLLRSRRSWRHRRDGALGAWAEVLDALVLGDGRGPGAESAVQLGARLRDEYGAPAGSRLAALAERAAFGPGPAPALATPLHDDVREVRRAVRRRLSWWRRAWWPFDHRVLLRRRITP